MSKIKYLERRRLITYLGNKLTTDSESDAIIRSAFTGLSKLFDFRFATVSGSLGLESDIDLLVCVNKPVTYKERLNFKNLYFGLHKQFERSPDKKYPGELIDTEALFADMGKALAAEPVTNIQTEAIYNGLVWAGMISFPQRTTVLDDARQLHSDAKMLADKIISKWFAVLEGSSQRPDRYLKNITSFDSVI